MSSRAWKWKRSEALRAVKVAQDAGLPITAVKTNPQTGEITVYTNVKDVGIAAVVDANSNALDLWIRSHADQAQGH